MDERNPGDRLKPATGAGIDRPTATGAEIDGPTAPRAATDRPTAGELATAVREFLEAEILPTLDDHRLRFRTLVAMNALSIVERESPAPTEADWTLARRIREGDIRETDLAQLNAEVAARLAIASPRFLDRYRPADKTDR